jgi:hypothetical protein
MQPYRPSNGDEGEGFMCDWCYRCAKDRGRRQCDILTRSMAFDITDLEYPTEWIEEEDGPRCTAFVKVGSVPRKLSTSYTRSKRQLELAI